MRLLLAAALLLAAPAAGARSPSLRELQRDVTVVAFWATWCRPCQAELQLLEALQRKYRDDGQVRIVAVSIDEARRAPAARRLAARLRLTMPLLVGGEPLYADFFGRGDSELPRLAIIDRRRAGFERSGAPVGETADDFVADAAAIVESLRAGAPPPVRRRWRAFTLVQRP